VPVRLTPDVRLRVMRSIRSKHTKPEVAVRKLAHALGFRFRLHRRDIPGTPDLAFIKPKKAVFVHGCFWHQHPKCHLARTPRGNTAYWVAKLRKNVDRHKRVERELERLGWECLVIWECETSDAERVRGSLVKFLK